MTSFLGIDYGTKKIGLSLATTNLAEPLTTIPNNDSFLSSLNTICQSHHISSIIIGLPQGSLVSKIKAFAKNIHSHLKIPVILHDETLSSHEANNKLMHTKRQKRSLPQDAYQATIILQDYLDTHP